MNEGFFLGISRFFFGKIVKVKTFRSCARVHFNIFQKKIRKLLLRSALQNRNTIYYLYLTFTLDVLLSNLLAPVSNEPFNGCSMLFSPLSDRVCGDADFARLFSFG